MDSPLVDAAVFEGMFIRAVQPDPEFAAELREAGFNLAKIQPRYPAPVWVKALQIARRRLYGDQQEEAGYRSLGNRFVEGYFETIIGKILSIPLALVSPDRVIQRLPKTWKAARPDVNVDPPVKEGPQRWRVHFHDQHSVPGFVAGIVEGASRRTTMGNNTKVEIERVTPQGFDLVITW
jgi:uncharacterized protein (TIGR02265 family)